MLEDKDGFAILHEPSVGDRRPATASKGHCTGHIMVGPWPGRVLNIESHLEQSWAYCLNAHPMTKTLCEQVSFRWQATSGKWLTHYFDFCVEQVDGLHIAYSVKPEARLTAKFQAEIAAIARQAIDTGFGDDVRLLMDTDLDQVELSNAKLTYSMRKPDPEADNAAAEAILQMTGVVTLAELTSQIGKGARGYRALIRNIGQGCLRLTRHELITHSTEVFRTGVAA
ncbi:hypothetical protein [Paracoccus rhizosphaerae]|uniref:TnsA endonuclease N-terminal domain-containing protein n=1 Tax=Paracoccus rhizosphaerae TaxID=1133347 RepID=A0ABV6CN18_9RHOB|nr:hypothetical protein [Paracoccus rhizosphaerae]